MADDSRRWTLRVCTCGVPPTADAGPCAGFPGAWNDERGDYERVACVAEFVQVEVVTTEGAE